MATRLNTAMRFGHFIRPHDLIRPFYSAILFGHDYVGQQYQRIIHVGQQYQRIIHVGQQYQRII